MEDKLLTYEQAFDLVQRGLAVMKNDGKFTTFKYHRRAMYAYLWHSVPQLMECRGVVFCSNTKELVQAAPRKSFNYLENDYWWKDVPLHEPVYIHKKLNGYMACATAYKGELVVSTTGSTTSEYAKWAKELLLKQTLTLDFVICEEASALFEVIVPQDPHIVKEKMGMYLLGSRYKSDGRYSPLCDEDDVITLAEAIAKAEIDRGEGFMVYRVSDKNCLSPCKLKTPYYVGKKKLMRMSAKNIEVMYKDPFIIAAQLPPLWYEAPEYIVRKISKDVWLSSSDQQRRIILEDLKG